MATTEEILKAFNIPDWYFPSKTEIARLQEYLNNTESIEEARWARFLDCSAICDEDDCFFCNEIVQSVASPKFQ